MKKIPIGKIVKFIKANPWARELIRELGIFVVDLVKRKRKKKKDDR